MGGLCIGSLLLPRCDLARTASAAPLCASSNSASRSAPSWCTSAFRWSVASTSPARSTECRACCCAAFIAAVCLLPPTILMGASLPAIVALDQVHAATASPGGACSTAATPSARSSAACWPASTCCASTTWRPPPTSRRRSTSRSRWRSFALAARTPAETSGARHGGPAPQPAPPRIARRWPVYVAIALSGATALGAEVVWTRLLGMLLAHRLCRSPIILAVFLIGLAIGSAIGSMLVRTRARAAGARLVPDAAHARHRVDRVDDRRRRCRTGRSIRCSTPTPGTRSNSIWCAACGRSCRQRSCGARVFRSRVAAVAAPRSTIRVA